MVFHHAEPVTIIRKSGAELLGWPSHQTGSVRTVAQQDEINVLQRADFCNVAETSSNSGSESNNARKPTKRSGSSPHCNPDYRFLATAAFIVFPVRIGPWLENNILPTMQRTVTEVKYGSNMRIWHSDRSFGTKMASLSLNRSWLCARLLHHCYCRGDACGRAECAPLCPPVCTASDTYKPKFPGDPRAQTQKPPWLHAHCPARPASSTKRMTASPPRSRTGHTVLHQAMVNTDRGDYTVGFQGKKDTSLSP